MRHRSSKFFYDMDMPIPKLYRLYLDQDDPDIQEILPSIQETSD